jgi:hypothetical protein
MKNTLLALFFIAALHAQGQISTKNKPVSDLPYYEIPSYPETYTAGNVAARIIDGLGFRYYWATEGLRENDLRFKPSVEARTSLETLSHIYELSLVVVSSTNKKPYQSGAENLVLPFAELRTKTLTNFKSASDRLKASKDKDLDDLKLVIKRESGSSEFPFWSQLNGPIADALWHVGQVVTFRRSSGNPIDEKANVFTGKWKE